MASTVALVSSSASGWRCAAATTPRTSPPASSGSTSHAEAGGSKGLATSQVAGSWKTRARPPAEASRHASCSKRSSSARPMASTSAPEAAKRRRIGTSSASGR